MPGFEEYKQQMDLPLTPPPQERPGGTAGAEKGAEGSIEALRRKALDAVARKYPHEKREDLVCVPESPEGDPDVLVVLSPADPDIYKEETIYFVRFDPDDGPGAEPEIRSGKPKMQTYNEVLEEGRKVV